MAEEHRLNEHQEQILVQLKLQGKIPAEHIVYNLGLEDDVVYDALIGLKKEGFVNYTLEGNPLKNAKISITRKGRSYISCLDL